MNGFGGPQLGGVGPSKHRRSTHIQIGNPSFSSFTTSQSQYFFPPSIAANTPILVSGFPFFSFFQTFEFKNFNLGKKRKEIGESHETHELNSNQPTPSEPN
ncbi:hypothetical protein M9H77_11311 [Catharanthus roseus]|uniref:Uncharacterized protein n=1 Tax=Catharanthus roseus TaxID=4058 RepID=A0ACC0BEE0_CATRO|nr:hypothetical protein M9H77_11311 [Catharanthus roseus]